MNHAPWIDDKAIKRTKGDIEHRDFAGTWISESRHGEHRISNQILIETSLTSQFKGLLMNSATFDFTEVQNTSGTPREDSAQKKGTNFKVRSRVIKKWCYNLHVQRL